MTVRMLEKRDLPEVHALEQLCFHNPWGEESLALLCGDTAFGIVAEENGRVLAYGGMVTVLDEGQITNIATHPDHRRRGLGRAVVKALLDTARTHGLVSISLEVRESNLAAIALYQRLGFVTCGRRPHFYTHPAEAALVMVATL